MEQNDYISGYQYSPEKLYFIGVYLFPNNMDKEDIHLPPFTTLTPPPDDIPNGSRAYWRDGQWSVEADIDSVSKPDFPAINIHDLLPKFIEDCKKYGLYDSLMEFYSQNPQLTDPATAMLNAAPIEPAAPAA